MPAGWTGVDLFFVISGYLITSILISRPLTGRVLFSFYVRRALRIWPIYYLGLAFVVLVNPWIPWPYSLVALPYYLTYTQNVWFYWGAKPVPFNPAFDHTWTLALEEQYYLVWPLFLAVVSRRFLPVLCLATAGVAYLGRSGFVLDFPYPLVMKELPDCVLLSRCDGFALGGLLAWILGTSAIPRRYAGGLLWAALGGASLYLGTGLSQEGLRFFGVPKPAKPGPTILMVEVFYLGVVGLVVLHSGKPVLAWLRQGWLCWLGMISYGIYLYHYLIYWIVDGCAWNYDRAYQQSWSVGFWKVVITLAVATISWYAIERPLLGLKDRFPYESSKGASPESGP